MKKLFRSILATLFPSLVLKYSAKELRKSYKVILRQIFDTHERIMNEPDEAKRIKYTELLIEIVKVKETIVDCIEKCDSLILLNQTKNVIKTFQ